MEGMEAMNIVEPLSSMITTLSHWIGLREIFNRKPELFSH